MNLRISKFCSIATSATWHTWLFSIDRAIYQRFIKRLHISKGCSQNNDIMLDILKDLKASGYYDQLMDYLNNQHPDIVIKPNIVTKTLSEDPIFGYYNPSLITYPRRIILSGSDLESVAKSFVSDKLAFEYIIFNNRAYIEFLLNIDENIMMKLPPENWKIRAFKNGKETTT